MTGKTNPYDNLTQVAADLAIYLSNVSPDQLSTVVKNVRNKYGAPRESWIWGSLYWLVNGTSRVGDVDAALKNFNTTHESKQLLSLFEDPTAGWKETSFNTNFLRELIKQLPDYDLTIQLDVKTVKRLKDLLIDAVQVQITRQIQAKEIFNEFDRIQKDFDTVQTQLCTKQKDLEDCEENLKLLIKKGNKQEEEIGASAKQLADLAQEVAKKEEELKQIEERRLAELAKLEAKSKLIQINLDSMDFHGLNDTQLAEAEKNAVIAYRTTIAEFQEKAKRVAEMNSFKTDVSQKQKTLLQADIFNSKFNKEKMSAELQAVATERGKQNNTNIKSQLENIYKKTPVESVDTSPRDKRLISLIKTGSHAQITQSPQQATIIDDYIPPQKAAPTREDLLNELLRKQILFQDRMNQNTDQNNMTLTVVKKN